MTLIIKLCKTTLLFFFLFPAIAFSQEKLIELKTEETSLESVLLELEKTHGFLFSYKESDIQNINVLPPIGKKTIDQFLSSVLKKADLRYEILDNNFVIISKSDKPAETSLPLSLLCGTVLDQLSQSPLAYANVYIKKTRKGISSSEDGSFQLQLQLEPKDTLIISYVGYQDREFPATAFIKKPCQTIALKHLELAEDFVVVTDYLTDGISLNNNGAFISLQPRKTGALPGQAEPDVLHAIQFLPGLTSPDGSASNLSIRGGSSDQNLILWEDIPIYHAAHYFGMISAFNPYIIKKVDVYRSGFDVEYGGRISGLINLKSDDYKSKSSDFGLGANFLNAYTNGKVSLFNQKTSVVYSVRRSIADLWRSPTFNNITRRIHQGVLLQTPVLNKLPKGISIQDQFKFLDANIKSSFRLSDRDELTIAWFYGENRFEDIIKDNNVRQEQSDTLDLESTGTSIAWTHDWNPAFSTKILGVSTDFQYDYDYQVLKENEANPDKIGQKQSKINERQIHLLNTYQTAKKHKIKAGYQLMNYDVSYLITKSNRQTPQAAENTSLKSSVHTGYATFNSSKEKRIGIDAGVRWSYFEKEDQQYLEPRLRLWYNKSDDLSFYINAGKYYQFLSQLIEIEGDKASIDTPVWVLAGDREVPVLNSNQFLLGMIYHKKSWLIDIQTYYKKINGLTSLATGFDEDLGNNFHLGSANIRGFDLLIKKRWKNYSSWISYSLSKSDHEFKTFLDPEFPASIDQPHVFHWVNLWKFGNFNCSLGWKIASGKPYSLKENYRIRINETPNGPRETIRPIINQFNSKRLPSEHQLDASLSYTLQLDKQGYSKAVFGLSLFNIYHQRNIYNRSFFISKNQGEPPSLEYIDRVNMGFTPNFSARLEW